jgi:hypothetical protein
MDAVPHAKQDGELLRGVCGDLNVQSLAALGRSDVLSPSRRDRPTYLFKIYAKRWRSHTMSKFGKELIESLSQAAA